MFLLACGVALLQAATASAQAAAGGGATGGDKSYAIPYLIIVLVVALGLFITLRPAGRSTEIKRDPRSEL